MFFTAFSSHWSVTLDCREVCQQDFNSDRNIRLNWIYFKGGSGLFLEIRSDLK